MDNKAEKMNIDGFIDNITEQIKEAQLKLGFAREVIRLYFPVSSLCGLFEIEDCSAETLIDMLEREEAFNHTVLGVIRFSQSRGRIEVCVPCEGAVYVHEHVADPPFLAGIIGLFREKHDLTIGEICRYFESFGADYVCEKMDADTDFDYVLYFPDSKPDSWYYCIKMEMDHTIYHRFTKADYHALVKD